MDNHITQTNNLKPWRYDMVMRLLHWIMAVLLAGMVAVGWYMVSIEDQPNSGWYFGMHKSFGLIVAMLVLLRLTWRFSFIAAPLPTSVPRWQAILARIIHWLLYACMILMPLTGFVGSSFGKHGVAFFGWQIPEWINKNPDYAHQLLSWHGTIAWVLVALVALHVLAAFKHLLINRDQVFQRMWF